MPNRPIVNGRDATTTTDCTHLRADIETYEKLVANYRSSLNSASDPYVRQDLADGLAAASDTLSELYANFARYCVPAPVGGKQFKIGAWQLVSGKGIYDGTSWSTGSVWSVLPLPQKRLLVGTEQGGLWISEPDGSGFKSECLSNGFLEWGISAMVADPAHPSNVFAGCGAFDSQVALFTGSVDPVQMHSWSRIALPFSLLANPTNPASGVTALIILPTQRMLIVGTQAGLGWTEIDARRVTTEPGGALEPIFVWSSSFGSVSDMVNSSRPGSQGDEFVVIQNGQLFRGTIGATLNLTGPSTITWQKAPSQFIPTRLASCKGARNNIYCLGQCPKNDGLSGTPGVAILKSVDGGQTWAECTYSATAIQGLATSLSFFTPGPKSPSAIAVHPTDPSTIAVGFLQVAISRDGGSTWTAVAGSHADIHDLDFDDNGDLWVPSDGGLLSSSAGGVTNSDRNQTLPILMLLPPGATPQFLGNMSVGGGFIACATQDNNNVVLEIGDDTWRPLDQTGDGGMVALWEDDADVLAVSGSGANNIKASLATREASGWTDHGIIPLNISGNSLDSSGLVGIFRPVHPQVGLRAGPASSPVMAVCSGGAVKVPFLPPIFQAAVYGAVNWRLGPPSGPAKHLRFVEWVRIGTVPLTETIAALEPFDSSSVLVGTGSGRLFIVSLNGTVRELSFDTANAGSVYAIASDGQMILCARGFLLFAGTLAAPLTAFDPNVFPPNGYGPTSRGPAVYRSLSANRNDKHLRLTFAAVVAENGPTSGQSEVWVSNSPVAGLWHKVVEGLPASMRGSDVVFSEGGSSGRLYLSTFGRSVWQLDF